MDVAIAIGHHPAFYLAAASSVPFGTDEYSIAGGLLGHPLPIVRCETVDLEVPSHAEIVIEGIVPPDERDWEGPTGEVAGLYGRGVLNPVINVTAITTRTRPIYQDIFAGHLEARLLVAIGRTCTIYRHVSTVCPSVRHIHLPASGHCRFICYVALDKRHDGEAKDAILAALAAYPSIKYCVAVDADVDILDDEQVLMAISTCYRPDRDESVIHRSRGNPADPTADADGLVTKVGIDATRPLTGFPETIEVSGSEEINLQDYF